MELPFSPCLAAPAYVPSTLGLGWSSRGPWPHPDLNSTPALDSRKIWLLLIPFLLNPQWTLFKWEIPGVGDWGLGGSPGI
jgi:hypothetical protein